LREQEEKPQKPKGLKALKRGRERVWNIGRAQVRQMCWEERTEKKKKKKPKRQGRGLGTTGKGRVHHCGPKRKNLEEKGREDFQNKRFKAWGTERRQTVDLKQKTWGILLTWKPCQNALGCCVEEDRARGATEMTSSCQWGKNGKTPTVVRGARPSREGTAEDVKKTIQRGFRDRGQGWSGKGGRSDPKGCRGRIY